MDNSCIVMVELAISNSLLIKAPHIANRPYLWCGKRKIEGIDNNQMDADAFSSLRSCEGAGHLGVKFKKDIGLHQTRISAYTKKL